MLCKYDLRFIDWGETKNWTLSHHVVLCEIYDNICSWYLITKPRYFSRGGGAPLLISVNGNTLRHRLIIPNNQYLWVTTHFASHHILFCKTNSYLYIKHALFVRSFWKRHLNDYIIDQHSWFTHGLSWGCTCVNKTSYFKSLLSMDRIFHDMSFLLKRRYSNEIFTEHR